MTFPHVFDTQKVTGSHLAVEPVMPSNILGHIRAANSRGIAIDASPRDSHANDVWRGLKMAFVTLIATTILWPPLGLTADTLTVGIVPQFSARELHDQWKPLFNILQETTKLSFRIKTVSDRETFRAFLMEDRFDLAFVNPNDVVYLAKQKHYKPLVRDAKASLIGIVVTRKGSGIDELEQLRGESVLFPSPTSFGATLLVRSHLADAGIDILPRYIGSHAAVYLNVALGQAIAGGGVTGSLEKMPEEVRRRLQIIYTTPTYAPHAWMANPRLDSAIFTRIQRALLLLNETESGRAALKSAHIKLFAPALIEEYDAVAALKMIEDQAPASAVKP